MQIMFFQSQVFHLRFMFLSSAGFKFYAKIMGAFMFFVVQVILAQARSQEFLGAREVSENWGTNLWQL